MSYQLWGMIGTFVSIPLFYCLPPALEFLAERHKPDYDKIRKMENELGLNDDILLK